MSTLKDLMREYWAHRPMELAAALSYYSLLSLAPLVLMTVALAALLFERGAVETTIVTEIRALIGDSGARWSTRSCGTPTTRRPACSRWRSARSFSSWARPRCSCSFRMR